MPQSIEIPIDPAVMPSRIIGANNAQRATLIIQASALLTNGAWSLRATPTADNSISGDSIATVVYPATPASRVVSVSVDLPQKYLYVNQDLAPEGGTIEKISVILQ
jgi:hypothetical protein